MSKIFDLSRKGKTSYKISAKTIDGNVVWLGANIRGKSLAKGGTEIAKISDALDLMEKYKHSLTQRDNIKIDPESLAIHKITTKIAGIHINTQYYNEAQLRNEALETAQKVNLGAAERLIYEEHIQDTKIVDLNLPFPPSVEQDFEGEISESYAIKKNAKEGWEECRSYDLSSLVPRYAKEHLTQNLVVKKSTILIPETPLTDAEIDEFLAKEAQKYLYEDLKIDYRQFLGLKTSFSNAISSVDRDRDTRCDVNAAYCHLPTPGEERDIQWDDENDMGSLVEIANKRSEKHSQNACNHPIHWIQLDTLNFKIDQNAVLTLSQFIQGQWKDDIYELLKHERQKQAVQQHLETDLPQLAEILEPLHTRLVQSEMDIAKGFWMHSHKYEGILFGKKQHETAKDALVEYTQTLASKPEKDASLYLIFAIPSSGRSIDEGYVRRALIESVGQKVSQAMPTDYIRSGEVIQALGLR